MRLLLKTLHKTNESTLGALYIDNVFQCFTLEDMIRPMGLKVYGKTAIPEGIYTLGLRKGSPLAKRYDKRYRKHIPHCGMLWVKGVPNFKWIYIHPGNSSSDTEGCILIGNTARKTCDGSTLAQSRTAYRALYPLVSGAIERGANVTLEVQRF